MVLYQLPKLIYVVCNIKDSYDINWKVSGKNRYYSILKKITKISFTLSWGVTPYTFAQRC